jgi:hypothetical protein
MRIDNFQQYQEQTIFNMNGVCIEYGLNDLNDITLRREGRCPLMSKYGNLCSGVP